MTAKAQAGLSVRLTSRRLQRAAARRVLLGLATIAFGSLVISNGAAWAGVAAIAIAVLWAAGARGQVQSARRFEVGARAEENVGARLDCLESLGWRVEHDVQKMGGGNIDHVVHAPDVSFTIDTKAARWRDRDVDQAHRHLAWAVGCYGGRRPIVPVICVDAANMEPVLVGDVSIVGGPQLTDLLLAKAS